MENIEPQSGYMNLAVTILGAAGAVYHFFFAHKDEASFLLGVMATGVALIAGIMTIRDRYYSTKVHKQNLKK